VLQDISLKVRTSKKMLKFWTKKLQYYGYNSGSFIVRVAKKKRHPKHLNEGGKHVTWNLSWRITLQGCANVRVEEAVLKS